MSDSSYTVGIISDTHGVVPPSVHEAFRGVNEIIHAGDIGDEDVLIELGVMASVRAVYGNIDDWRLRKKPAKHLEFELFGQLVRVSHIECSPTDDRPTICITGHTHVPKVARIGRILYINPGSAGKPPKGQPASVALLKISSDGRAEAQIIFLKEAQ